MPSRDYPAIAAQYADDVLSGKQIACKWVRLACERQINDLARQGDESFAFRFEPNLATHVCWFVEQAPHIKGKLRGRKIRLEPWQVFILTTAFGWINKDTCQ